MKNIFLVIISILLFFACSTPEKAEIEVVKIDSKQLIDSLNQVSDTVFTDTADYQREPKAKLYIQKDENLRHQVFSDSLGNVVSWIIYKDTTVEFVQKYYPNGQYWNRVDYDDNDRPHGEYKFYFPNGQVKMKGVYIHGEEVSEKRVLFDKNGYKIEKK